MSLKRFRKVMYNEIGIVLKTVHVNYRSRIKQKQIEIRPDSLL